MDKKKLRIALAGAALCAGGAWAQPAPPLGGPDSPGQMLGGPMRHDLLFVAGAQLEQERVVQGAPYCADAVHEAVQALADGNRIVHRQVSRQCRDGQGRTRQEVTTRSGRVNVFVRDPVAREAWMLEPDRKLAVRLDLPRQPLLGPEPRVWDRFIEWGHQLRDKLRWAGPAEAPPEAMRIALRADAAELGAMPPPIALHARLLGPRGPGTTSMLPGETIEGLRADGKRTTWTIEAGRIGNEKPISIVNEVWSSPELGITLRTRDVDPVVGEATFSVRNVVRGEPDAQLFRVPADFAKASAPAMTMRGRP